MSVIGLVVFRAASRLPPLGHERPYDITASSMDELVAFTVQVHEGSPKLSWMSMEFVMFVRTMSSDVVAPRATATNNAVVRGMEIIANVGQCLWRWML